MKTIKGATGSKSVILRKLALPFLMLVAILGIEIGGGQTVPREKSPVGPEIGGNSAPRNYAGVSAKIGGGQETRKSPIGPDIGGNSVPRQFASGEIGGQNQQKPTDTNPLGIMIGGESAPRHLAIGDLIGTQGSETRNGKSGDIGGGQTVPRPFSLAEIGGNGGSLPPRSKPDIGGGQNPPRSGLYISSFLQDCTVDIGGTQGVPRLPFDIGGNGSGSHNPRNFHPGLI